MLTAAYGAIDIEPGELIGGRYRVEALIARGGQASVWKAKQEPLERAVALKILTPPPSREDSEPFQERFLLEARTLASLSHPNIVVVYDYGEVRDGHFYIAMEYVEGVRFSEILRAKPRDIPRTLRLISQVCRALRYAHNRGVIHRDVKNANILVHRSEEGEELVKVVDFGIVKLQEADPGITQEGVILGSPHFMAPEQIRGEVFDHRADIYAVGVLMYCAVVGRYPFRGKTPQDIMRAHLTQPIPDLAAIKHGTLRADTTFHAIIHKALHKDPEQRYQFMDGLLEALLPYTEALEPEPEMVELDPEAQIPDPSAPESDGKPPPPQLLEGDELSGEIDALPPEDELADEVTVQANMGLHPFHDNMSTQQLSAIADEMHADIVEEPPAPRNLADIVSDSENDSENDSDDGPATSPAAIALQPISASKPAQKDTEAGPKPEPESEPEQESEPEPESEPEQEPEPESESEPEPESAASAPAEPSPVEVKAAVVSSMDVLVIEEETTPRSRLLMLGGVAFVGTLVLVAVIGWAGGFF